jgi:flagellar protein FliS
MQDSTSNRYQQGELLTAPPQRLQYLLVDGAIRFAKRAKKHWQTGDFEQGGEAMDRCEAVLTEILRNIRPDCWVVADQIAALYLFLVKSASEAHFRHDTEQLDKVIAILETERETWRVLCESPIEADTSQAAATDSEKQHRHDGPAQTAGAPVIPPIETPISSPGFSLEA